MMKKIFLFIILLTSLTFGQSDLLLLFDDADSVDSPTSILAVGNVAKITLSWTNAATYDSVKIYRGTSTNPTTLVYTLAGATTSKIDSALTEETIYYYRVQGKIGSNLSSYSSNASDTVLAIMYAVDLDGSTEYMSKTTPVNLDLNGTEKITDSKNRDMDGAVDYATNSNHSVTDSVTADKHAGTYSMTITSTDVGDATTNYVSLASSEFTTLVSGEKYTFEAWMRGTGIVSGSDLCLTFTNGATNVYETFTTANDSISSAIETGTNGAGYSNDLGSFAVGDQYQVTFSATLTSGTAPTVGFNATNNLGTVIGTFQTVTAGANTLYFYISTASTVPVLTFKNTAASNFIIDDADVKKVTAPTCTLAVGNQTEVTTNIRCVPVAANWTKVVWNFQATANEVNQPIKIFYNQADIVYVDDVSLTQAYDMIFQGWANLDIGEASANGLISRRSSSTGSEIGYNIYHQAGDFYRQFDDGTLRSQVTYNSDFADALWHHWVVIFNRLGYTYTYLDGVKKDSTLLPTLGKVSSTATLGIGVFITNNNFPWQGSIGETQITRFTDIATSNYTPLQIYNRSKAKLHFPNAYTGGTIVGHWKFSGATDGVMLQDYSASGNNLTGTNTTQAGDQVTIITGY